jgi:hypothetical protein
MVKVDPPVTRIQMINTANGVEITIPAKVNVFVALFLMLWLCGWAVGLVSASSKLLSGPSDAGGTVFLTVWLGGWIVGGAFAILTLAWMLVGREILRISVAELQYVRTVGLFSISREYEMAQVKRLRVFGEQSDGVQQSKHADAALLWRSAVAFDYGAATPRFGMGLDEAEARTLVETLRTRFHSLAAA